MPDAPISGETTSAAFVIVDNARTGGLASRDVHREGPDDRDPWVGRRVGAVRRATTSQH